MSFFEKRATLLSPTVYLALCPGQAALDPLVGHACFLLCGVHHPPRLNLPLHHHPLQVRVLGSLVAPGYQGTQLLRRGPLK